jgi:CBS domain-containing protein
MNIGNIARRNIITAAPSDTLSEVVKLMAHKHVGAVIIVKRTASRLTPVGIVTDRDVVRALADKVADTFTLSAADVMTADPLDAHGALVGIVSVDDLLYEVGKDLAGLVGLIARQPTVEGTLP